MLALVIQLSILQTYQAPLWFNTFVRAVPPAWRAFPPFLPLPSRPLLRNCGGQCLGSTKPLRSVFILSEPLTFPFQQPAAAGLLKKTTLEPLKPALLQAERAASDWESVSLAMSKDCWYMSVKAPAPCLRLRQGWGTAYLQDASPRSHASSGWVLPPSVGLLPELHVYLPPHTRLEAL